MMMTYGLLKDLEAYQYLVKDTSSSQYIWRITQEGREIAKLKRRIEQHPAWEELFF